MDSRSRDFKERKMTFIGKFASLANTRKIEVLKSTITSFRAYLLEKAADK